MNLNLFRSVRALAAIALMSIALPSAPSAAAASMRDATGLQLYSLRADFTRNVPTSLDKTRAFGFKKVELAGTYNLTPSAFREMLDARGLKAVSGHYQFDRFRDDVEGIAKDCKTLGVQFVGCPWIPHEGSFDEKECRQAIDVFNKAGAALAKHGIQFFYHAHGYEFEPHGKGTLFDLLATETDAKNVKFQMDVLWVV